MDTKNGIDIEQFLDKEYVIHLSDYSYCKYVMGYMERIAKNKIP
jgi:hypothetical protein